MFGSRLPAVAGRALALLAALTTCACGGPDRTLAHGSSVVALAISHDGLRLASGGADGHVKIWETATGALVHDLGAGQDGILAMAFSPDGRKLGVVHSDQVSVWMVASGQVDHVRPLGSLTILFEAQLHPIAVALAPDVMEGLYADGPWELILAWRAAGFTAAMSSDGKTIACEGFGAAPGERSANTVLRPRTIIPSIEMADTRSQRVTARLTAYPGLNRQARTASARSRSGTVTVTPDGRVLTFECRVGKPGEQITDTQRPPDCVLTLWDPAANRAAWTLPFRTAPIPRGWTSVSSVSPQTADGRLVVASINRFEGRRAGLAGFTRRFAFFVQGRAYVEETSEIVVLDGASGTQTHSLGSHGGKDASLAVAPDGSLAAAGGEDGRVRLWRLR